MTTLFSFARVLEKAFSTEFSDDFFIAKGFDEQLDEYRNLSSGGKEQLARICEHEIQVSGISSLKIKFNKIFGYFFELPKSQSKNLPPHFILKQTLANSDRYTTPELKDFEEKILSSESLAHKRQQEIFLELQEETKKYMAEIQELAKMVAETDVVQSFAQTAKKRNFKKPTLCEERKISIYKGRHPVVQHFLEHKSQSFVPNTLEMTKSDFHLITGPNMAGKSTYLRQNALIIFLAHIGSFVPAEKTEIMICDSIFTRIGSGDSLSTGESTFLVEMQESSRILRNATQKSFVILDEIGRGTSTYDGLSIAWSMMEFLCEKKIKTLFATHYHELISLAEKTENAKNFSSRVLEDRENGVIFLHEVQEGGAEKSFGIEVARLAGVPKSVVERAKTILSHLEQSEKKSKDRGNQISLFNFSEILTPQPENLLPHAHSKTEKFLEELDPNLLSPMEALQKIFEMKKMLEK